MPRRRTIIDVELKKGSLSKFGYHVDNSTQSRHRALLKGARMEGYVPLIRRLGLEATFLKNTSPAKSRVFKDDQDWLSNRYNAWKMKNGGPEAPRFSLRGSSLRGMRHECGDYEEGYEDASRDVMGGMSSDEESTGEVEEETNENSSAEEGEESNDDNASSSGTDGGTERSEEDLEQSTDEE